jgi:DNA-binding NarL/FixJ family response regulator
MKIRVLVVDDHALLRAAFRSLLERIEHCEVVGEAKNGLEALEMLRQHRPDLVLMDIAMQGMGGLEAAAKASTEFPDTRIVVLSMHTEPEFVYQALRAGARGYILKDAAVPELEIAVRAVMKGDVYFSPAISTHVVTGYLRATGSEAAQVAELTARQREILTFLAEGHPTKEIARRLGISTKTVDAHRGQLMERLDIRDIASLVRFAVRAGLIKPGD